MSSACVPFISRKKNNFKCLSSSFPWKKLINKMSENSVNSHDSTFQPKIENAMENKFIYNYEEIEGLEHSSSTAEVKSERTEKMIDKNELQIISTGEIRNRQLDCESEKKIGTLNEEVREHTESPYQKVDRLLDEYRSMQEEINTFIETFIMRLVVLHDLLDGNPDLLEELHFTKTYLHLQDEKLQLLEEKFCLPEDKLYLVLERSNTFTKTMKILKDLEEIYLQMIGTVRNRQG